MRLSLLLLVVIAALAAACGRPVPTTPPPPTDNPNPRGTLGGPCATGGFCNDDLICVDDLCALDPAAGEGEGEEGEGEEGEGEGEPCTDVDEDGSCAGPGIDDDCDDGDRSRFPGNEERCSFVDEDCDEVNNNGLDCTFLAHTRDTLYRIDPFAETVSAGRVITLVDGAGLLDIDEDPEGALLAATVDGIFEVLANNTLSTVADVPSPTFTNGICITGTGTLFLTNDDGADSAAWRVEGNNIVEVGGFSDGLVSSGDCVVTKEEDVLMSAKDPDNTSAPDLLVLVDSSSGATSTVGPIGFARVFGLSASFGFLFGVTSNGEVLLLDRNSGDAEQLFIARDAGDPIRFNGAANGD